MLQGEVSVREQSGGGGAMRGFMGLFMGVQRERDSKIDRK